MNPFPERFLISSWLTQNRTNTWDMEPNTQAPLDPMRLDSLLIALLPIITRPVLYRVTDREMTKKTGAAIMHY